MLEEGMAGAILKT